MTARDIAIGIALTLTAAQAAAQLAWDVKKFIPGSNSVVVIIDTTRLKANDILDSASLNIRFVSSSGKNLGTKRYEVVAPGSLEAGTVVGFEVIHGYSSVASVVPGEFRWSSHLEGAKADDLKVTTRGVSAQPVKTLEVAGVNAQKPWAAPPGSNIPAQLQRRCQAYAQLAKSQQEVNVQNSCGFTSASQWNADLKGHYQWCVTRGTGEAAAEALTRSRMLVEWCGG